MRELARDKAVLRFWWSWDGTEWTLTLEGRLAATTELGSADETFTGALLRAYANAGNVADRSEALRRVGRLLDCFGEKERHDQVRD